VIRDPNYSHYYDGCGKETATLPDLRIKVEETTEEWCDAHRESVRAKHEMRFAESEVARNQARVNFELKHLSQEISKLHKWRFLEDLKQNREAARRLKFDYKKNEERKKSLARLER
jgi:hypothetical protein